MWAGPHKSLGIWSLSDQKMECIGHVFLSEGRQDSGRLVGGSDIPFCTIQVFRQIGWHRVGYDVW